MKFLFCLGLVLALCLSCSTNRNKTVREPSGAGIDEGNYGSLRVYSATEPVYVDSVEYKVHTPYTILNENGQLVDQVTNRLTETSEEPVRVKLPAGSYIVTALSDLAGLISFRVNVEANLSSSVHIDGSWKMPDQLETQTQMIELPNGDIIGWFGQPITE